MGSCTATPYSVVRDLGVYIGSGLTMQSHVPQTVSWCFAVLRQLPVRKRQTTENGSPKTTSSHTPGTTQVQEPVVIVKFRYRSIRDAVLHARRILKGTRLSIPEDLTAVNVLTLNRIRNNPRVSTTWSRNGRLFSLLKSSRVPIVVKPYETLDQCILNQASDD